MSLFSELTVDLWLQPSAGQPGYNAVTDNEDFTLTGTADGYTTGDAGQEVIQMSGADVLDASGSFGTGTYLTELHDSMQFWIMVYWNPQGNTDTFQVAFQTANGANAGYRMRFHGDGSSATFYINDGSGGSVSFAPPVGKYADWDSNGGNVMLMQVNISGGWIEGWVNNRTTRTATFNRKDISGLTWPTSASPVACTIPAQCSLNGDVMFASGTGILTEAQIERLMQYGRGITWTELNAANGAPESVNSWRAMPGDGTLQVVGCFDEDPNLKIYADSSRTTRGALIESSGSLTRDAQGWASYTFTGLSNDTTYQVFAEYSSGYQDRRRMRVKTLPSSKDGIVIGFGGCWEWDPDIAFADAISVEQIERAATQTLIDLGVDVFCSTGDDGYYDYVWNDNLSQAGVPTTAANFQQCHEYVWAQLKPSNFWERIPFFAGSFSDHDSYGNDLFGDEVTNLAAAQGHLAQRYGRTYPNAPTNLYYSWTTPGITWITLDLRTESDQGVQLTSTAQRAKMQTDMEAAVARGDFIILFSEIPWDDGETPSPLHSWNRYTSERTDIFDRIVSAGAKDRIITVHGDHHAGAVDIQGTIQSGFDTHGIVKHPSILASRFNSPNGAANGATAWPDYYDGGNNHYIILQLQDNVQGVNITITPYEQATAKTALTRFLTGYPVNVNQSWRGAVEPAESGASGNEVQLWRGAVEPAAPAASSSADALIGGVTRSVTRSLTRGVTEGWSWGA